MNLLEELEKTISQTPTGGNSSVSSSTKTSVSMPVNNIGALTEGQPVVEGMLPESYNRVNLDAQLTNGSEQVNLQMKNSEAAASMATGAASSAMAAATKLIEEVQKQDERVRGAIPQKEAVLQAQNNQDLKASNEVEAGLNEIDKILAQVAETTATFTSERQQAINLRAGLTADGKELNAIQKFVFTFGGGAQEAQTMIENIDIKKQNNVNLVVNLQQAKNAILDTYPKIAALKSEEMHKAQAEYINKSLQIEAGQLNINNLQNAAQVISSAAGVSASVANVYVSQLQAAMRNKEIAVSQAGQYIQALGLIEMRNANASQSQAQGKMEEQKKKIRVDLGTLQEDLGFTDSTMDIIVNWLAGDKALDGAASLLFTNNPQLSSVINSYLTTNKKEVNKEALLSSPSNLLTVLTNSRNLVNNGQTDPSSVIAQKVINDKYALQRQLEQSKFNLDALNQGKEFSFPTVEQWTTENFDTITSEVQSAWKNAETDLAFTRNNIQTAIALNQEAVKSLQNLGMTDIPETMPIKLPAANQAAVMMEFESGLSKLLDATAPSRFQYLIDPFMNRTELAEQREKLFESYVQNFQNSLALDYGTGNTVRSDPNKFKFVVSYKPTFGSPRNFNLAVPAERAAYLQLRNMNIFGGMKDE